MICPDISELEFSERGKLAVKEIKRIKYVNQWLSSAIVVGAFANIFAGNGMIKSHLILLKLTLILLIRHYETLLVLLEKQ